MGYSAIIENGKVVETAASANSDSSTKKTGNDSLDKEAFLQLLVTQMQYQDPLEPTSNTEYISQLATFSELEAMNNLNSSMSIARASELVGQRVVMRTTSATTGETYMKQGIVDYVVIENGKAYLAIDKGLYSIDDLDMVIDKDYWENYEDENSVTENVTEVKTLLAIIAGLPDEITLDDEETVKAARQTYNAFSMEDKLLVDNESLYKLIRAEAAIAKLNAEKAKEGTESTEDTESTEGTENEAIE